MFYCYRWDDRNYPPIEPNSLIQESNPPTKRIAGSTNEIYDENRGRIQQNQEHIQFRDYANKSQEHFDSHHTNRDKDKKSQEHFDQNPLANKPKEYVNIKQK